MLVVLNIGEDDLKKTILPEDLIQKYRSHDIYITQISAKIENELLRLESKDERVAFLKDLGIDEPAIDKLTRLLYQAIGLISFFTTANKEVRAWTIKKESTAPDAAGAIHSDMKRGLTGLVVLGIQIASSPNCLPQRGRITICYCFDKNRPVVCFLLRPGHHGECHGN